MFPGSRFLRKRPIIASAIALFVMTLYSAEPAMAVGGEGIEDKIIRPDTRIDVCTINPEVCPKSEK